jgi:cell division protein FtsB
VSVLAPALGQRRLMLAIVCVGAVFVLFFPARQLVQQRQRIGSLEHRLTQLRAENDLLEQDVKRLSDPAELEVLARERLGLVKPGERAYFVEPVKPEPTTAPAEVGEQAWWERGWEWLTGLLRGRD